MAKLNGVKTIDMVNGEITKVVYEGAEYAKVDGAALKGDIGVVVNAWGDQEVGEYFKVKYMDEYNGKTFTNIDGNTCEASCYEHDMKYFRKISAQSKPTLEQRVETLESDVAALKGEKVEAGGTLKEGDQITINFDEWKKDGNLIDLTSGKHYLITKKHGELGFNDDDGHFRWSPLTENTKSYTIVKKFEETIEFEGATYRKVDREAREGDVVILQDTGGDLFKVGKTYKVVEGVQIADDDGDLFDLYRTKLRRTRETVDVYEKIEPASKSASEPKLKAGDFVKWTNGSRSLPNGEIFEVFEDMEGLHVIDIDGDKRWSALKNPLFKYEILSAEEIAKHREVEKWAKIGRKPNEFKIGDIVELTGSHAGHPIGTIGEVVKAPSHFVGTDIGVKANGHIKSHIGQMKLIAPVESLFNNA